MHTHFTNTTLFRSDPDAPFDVEDSTFEDARRLHETLGIERGVIVHSLVQGRTYEYLLNALSRDPEHLRAVAMPAPDITDRERSEEHTSELQSLMRLYYDDCCRTKKHNITYTH